MLVLSPNDHSIGHNIFDVITKQKISYAKKLPFEYANIEVPYVLEESVSGINEYSSQVGHNNIIYLQTYYNTDLNQIYGYYLESNVNYYGDPSTRMVILKKPVDPFVSDPELIAKFPALKSFYDKKIDMAYRGVYIQADGNTRFHIVNIRTSNLDKVDEFAELEKFELIRQCCLESNMPCAFKYCFDLQNPEQISIYVNDCISSWISLTDYFNKHDVEKFTADKAKYYQKYAEKGILTQEQVDYILESSPRNQNSNLKFLWVDNKITNIELESMCVNEYESI